MPLVTIEKRLQINPEGYVRKHKISHTDFQECEVNFEKYEQELKEDGWSKSEIAFIQEYHNK